MSYEANAHKVQMLILRALLFAPSISFAKLQKETGLSSDHFNFHIQKLVKDGLVKKQGSRYSLTKDGKEYANRMDTDENIIEKQPKLAVALIIENENGKFLSQQRLKQPFFGFWGRPTGKIRWGETLLETAERELLEETGLEAELKVGGFYHKMDYEIESGNMLEDKIFCVIYGTNPTGDLLVDAEGFHNEWLSNEDLAKKDKVFASVPEITAMGSAKEIGFLEKKYDYRTHEY